MAAQFVCLAGLRPRKTKTFTERATASSGETTKSTKYFPCYNRHQGSSNFGPPQNHVYKLEISGFEEQQRDGVERESRERKKGRSSGWAGELPRLLGLWYMASSISYILRKARKFYNEFCCDTLNDSIISNGCPVYADPYFSFPVIPPPTTGDHTKCMVGTDHKSW